MPTLEIYRSHDLSPHSISSEDGGPTPSEIAVYERMIDWQLDSLEEARDAWIANDTTRALTLVARQIFQRLGSEKSVPHGPTSPEGFLEAAELAMKGEVTLLHFGPVKIGTPIDWFSRSDVDHQWTVHLNYMYWINGLAETYRATGEERYAERWLEIVEDFLSNMPYGSPKMNYTSSRPAVLNHAKTCNNGESFGCPDAWISLACHIRIESWIHGLICLAGSKALTPFRALKIIASLNDEHLHIMVANPRENTPNQYLAISSSMVKLGVSFPEFKASNVAFQIGYQRLLRTIDNVMFADGSDLEQSVNYNVRFCNAMADMAEYLGAHAPERALVFREAARKRAMFIAGLLTPLGRTVSLAKTGLMPIQEKISDWADSLDLPCLHHIVSGGLRGEAPPFTSVAFPYGGYYSFRNNWSPTSDYLFFKASLNGTGHMHEDCLSIHISSGGKDLIIDSGNFSYTNQTPIDAAMNAYSVSSASHSTVLVDGHGQSRLYQRTKRPWNHDEAPHLRAVEQSALPNRALMGKFFEYVEGSYEDGYGADGSIPVRHHRSIVWLKGLGWLILDRFTEAKGHELTGVWTMSPEFSRDQVNLDPQNIAAASPDCAITLLPLSALPLTVTMLHGSDEPTGGWFSPQYGTREPKPDIHITWKSPDSNCLHATLILPRQVKAETTLSEPNAQAGSLNATVKIDGESHLALSCSSAGKESETQIIWTTNDGAMRKLIIPSEGSPQEFTTDNPAGSPLQPIPTPACPDTSYVS
jgi:hypothetical protein